MKTKTTTANRHSNARQLTLAQIAQIGPFLEGHLGVTGRIKTSHLWAIQNQPL